jgi:hypothetical protein
MKVGDSVRRRLFKKLESQGAYKTAMMFYRWPSVRHVYGKLWYEIFREEER